MMGKECGQPQTDMKSMDLWHTCLQNTLCAYGVFTGGAQTRQQQLIRLISATQEPARQNSEHREVHLVSQ